MVAFYIIFYTITCYNSKLIKNIGIAGMLNE